MADASRFTISELADAANTTPRTVRFYTAEGLLPPPDSRGRFALYSTVHLDRLLLINLLKQAFQPLNAIRAHMEPLTAADIRSILSSAKVRTAGEVLNYLIRRYGKRSHDEPNLAEDSSVQTRQAGTAQELTCRHIPLAPGIELVVQLPVTERMKTIIEAVNDTVEKIARDSP